MAKKKNSSASISERLKPSKTIFKSNAVTFNKKTNKLESKVSTQNNIISKPLIKPIQSKPITLAKPQINTNSGTNLAKIETKPKAPKTIESNLLPLKIKQIDPSFQIRKNDVIQTINTETNTVKLELYDNGDIDGDSVSVFYNNEILIYHKRLTDKPLILEIPVKDNQPNELVMYADNLGTIPPNTALLIVTDGKKRYEVRITSDLVKSGAIRFVHSKKE